jgi:hypothetical protein
MKSETLLHRHINPAITRQNEEGVIVGVTSQSFNPTDKDNGLLSVYNGDLIDCEGAKQHYQNPSTGVLSVSVAECNLEALEARPDPLDDFPEHAQIDFTNLTKREVVKKSKKLRDYAFSRGFC